MLGLLIGDNRPAAVEVDRIRYAYPHGVNALADLSFRAQPGEFVAVMGANGSGKTTLMKILMRLLRPQQGTVQLGGEAIESLRTSQLYRKIGMVFQNPADQLFSVTVAEDVAFGPRNLGLTETEVHDRVESALESAGVAGLGQRPIHRLSFGEQKRVCLAGVLAMRPEILVLDEPTAGLDPAGEAQMIDLLLSLHREGRHTIILSTHSVDLLPVLADRIYVLAKGQVFCEGPPRQILSDPQAAAGVGLRIPLVAQLFCELAAKDGLRAEQLPLTVDEARRQVVDWLRDRGGSP